MNRLAFHHVAWRYIYSYWGGTTRIIQPAAISRRGLCALATRRTCEWAARLAAANARRAQRRQRRLSTRVRGQGGVA
jgi:hypothetical protein